MIRNSIKRFVMFPFILSIWASALAQISFPKGNVLNLNTNNDFLYEETRIFFNTGIYKSDDYRWEKVSDSLDKRWFVTACFNGECRNELEQSGTFYKDFGFNDTTCFIAFHVETYEYTGTSVIKYNVYNKKNPSDSAILIFNISYTKLVGLDNAVTNAMAIYPNPVSSTFTLQSSFDLYDAEIKIFSLLGETVIDQKINNATFDITELNSGIYFIQIEATSAIGEGNKVITQKFMKQ